MELDELLESLRRYPGLTRKSVVGEWAGGFRQAGGGDNPVHGPGDDAGAVPLGDGYLLLAGEGMMPSLWRDPFFAGFAAVTANVNDIYAMGGRPLGLLTVVFAGGLSVEAGREFTRGMAEALEHYGVPVLGGHTSPDGGPAAAVCVAGYARNLVRGDGARPGDRILLLLDMEGRPYPPFNAWDTVLSASGESTLEKLELMTRVAGRRLCHACRDISNPGTLGTLAMMMESSRTGALVTLDSLPVPGGVDMEWWLKAYPSYGFVVSAGVEEAGEIRAEAEARGLTCVDFGGVVPGSTVEVSWKGREGRFLDWDADPVTGL